jgi:hypothetical protein
MCHKPFRLLCPRDRCALFIAICYRSLHVCCKTSTANVTYRSAGIFSAYIIQGAAFNVTHFESMITHLLYTALNKTEHGQVSHCLGFTKSLTSSIQRLGDVLHDNQGIAAISQVHLP